MRKDITLLRENNEKGKPANLNNKKDKVNVPQRKNQVS